MPLMLPNPECNIPLNSWSFDIDEFGVAVDIYGMAGDLGFSMPPVGTAAWFGSEVAEFYTVAQDVGATVGYHRAIFAGDKTLFAKESVFIYTSLTLDLLSLFPGYGTYANGLDIGKELLFGLERETVYACPAEPARVTRPAATPIPRRVPVPME